MLLIALIACAKQPASPEPPADTGSVPELPSMLLPLEMECTNDQGTWKLGESVVFRSRSRVEVRGLRWFGEGPLAVGRAPGIEVDLYTYTGCHGPVRIVSTVDGIPSGTFTTCRNTDRHLEDHDSAHAVCSELKRDWPCPPPAPGECSGDPVWGEGPGGQCCAFPSSCNLPTHWKPHADEASCSATRP